MNGRSVLPTQSLTTRLHQESKLSNSIELVAFDLGNVLCAVDERPVTIELASISGRSLEEVFETIFGRDRKALFEGGHITFAQHADQAITTLGLDLTLDEFTDLYNSVLIPSEDMFPLVSQITQRYRIALVSNTSEPHWKAAEKFLPFSSKLDPVIISCEVAAMKPDPAFYDSLLERSHVAAANTLFIDDLPANVEAALKMGFIGHQFLSRAELELYLADLGVI